ncbi:UDP-glucosyl transferase 89B1 [Actinidia rufa]|uniref:Glycosyltransferase n=1 Tax=Actinidia rufa TaxID=165716 RepID=A0A7J0EHM1_9ERIC|nr:UDP-glucosyl transferase 89B1 [Actinidia rufa]
MSDRTITGAGAHILVFPFPAQGHMIPLLDLTHQLASKGLKITILVTPKNLNLINPLLNAHPTAVEALVLPFPSSTAASVENAKDLPAASGFPAMIHALGGLRDPLLRWFRSHPSPPSAVVSDMFLGWTLHLGIRRYVFSPSGALALSVIYSLWRDMPKRDDIADEDALISFPEIPNSPIYPWSKLSTVYRSYVEGDPASEFIKDGFRADTASWGLVVNSFSELERVYLDHLRRELGHDRVWAVGPLLPPNNASAERGGSSSVLTRDVMTWLDTCEDRSVMYVCFGSQAVLTNKQMEEVGLGLEKSGVRFLWCIKEPTKGQVEGEWSLVPSGFEDRVAGKGLVVRGWAPQVLILRHRAIGAFLTHCGWNSVLEAIVYGGVPMLAWPMGADQFTNATLLVDELGVATRVCEGAQAVPNSDELALSLSEVMGEHQLKRVRAMELQKAALEAIGEGGSSTKDLDELVRHLG